MVEGEPKMRLIDADDLPSDVMLHVGEDDDEFEFVYMYDIEHAPTIEAIPVSFLEKLRDNAQNEEAALIIDEIIAQWEKGASKYDG